MTKTTYTGPNNITSSGHFGLRRALEEEARRLNPACPSTDASQRPVTTGSISRSELLSILETALQISQEVMDMSSSEDGDESSPSSPSSSSSSSSSESRQ